MSKDGDKMPWSPVPKFPDIIHKIRMKGYTTEVNFETLKITVIEILGLTSEKTIARTIEIMQTLGYVKLQPNGVIWSLCQGKPNEFYRKDNPEREADDLLDKIGGSDVSA